MIGNLIREAVSGQKNTNTSGAINVEKKFILPLKRLLKDSPEKGFVAEDIFKYLSMELNSKSGIVRLRALDLIDYFFTRSSAFRDVVAKNLKSIAQSGGILRQSSGTCGKAETLADQVQERVKGMIELWDHLYGIVFPSIHVLARFCRETMGLQMPNIVAQARSLLENARDQELSRRNRIITMKDNIIRRELSFFMNQVSASVKKIDECFEILFPGVVAQFSPADPSSTSSSSSSSSSSSAVATVALNITPVEDSEGAEFENIQWDEDDSSNAEVDVDQYLFNALSAGVPYTLEIPVATSLTDLQNEDNDIILQTIRENVRFVTVFALPKLKQWQSALSKSAIVLSEEAGENPRKKSRITESSSSYSSYSFDKSQEIESKVASDLAEIQSAQRDIKNMLNVIEDKILKKCKDFVKPSTTANDAILEHVASIIDN